MQAFAGARSKDSWNIKIVKPLFSKKNIKIQWFVTSSLLSLSCECAYAFVYAYFTPVSTWFFLCWCLCLLPQVGTRLSFSCAYAFLCLWLCLCLCLSHKWEPGFRSFLAKTLFPGIFVRSTCGMQTSQNGTHREKDHWCRNSAGWMESGNRQEPERLFIRDSVLLKNLNHLIG